MKNTYGQNVGLTIFGESHGAAVGAVIDGLSPGIPVDEAFIAKRLSLRRPYGEISTARREKDEFKIESGVFEGKTTGTPIGIIIPNEDTQSRDYAASRCKARPGHADYSAFCKYHGFEDYRGGGHFSGRVTAAVVAAGALFISALAAKNIIIGTRILSCAGISDRDFGDCAEDIKILAEMPFPVLDNEAAEKMKAAIADAKAKGDSVGGVLQTVILNLPAGLGEPYFDSMESMLAHAMFAVGGVKGIEFGAGFGFASLRGGDANDAFETNADGKIVTSTNRNGGINGGVTNGMPVIFNCAVKPTPSIAKEQSTVDFIKRENITIAITGRHDPCIVHRARAAVESLAALVVCDVLTGRYGADYLMP